MKLCNLPLWLIKANALFCLLTSSPIAAQIVPDATLPINSSVTSDGNTSIITGGTKAGSNLFHSFEQFFVPTGGEAFFNNAADIQNIISRVTGGSISNIDGLIRANGTANVFLLNPNGIIFGPNASLNIGGSFLASTASSLNFANGTQFNASAHSTTPLLTVSVPIGLGFGSNPGAIQVRGTGHSLTDPGRSSPLIRGNNLTGLRVQPRETLALVGGEVTLEGGNLIAEGGRIELGSVAGLGLVNLTPTDLGWNLGYEGVPNFKDIELSQQALVDASGTGSGSIQLQGAHVTLTDGSVIFIQNQGEQPFGSLNVNASEALKLSGISRDGKIPSSLRTQSISFGNGGDIAVFTRRLLLQEGAGISSTNYSTAAAKGGNVAVNASESVQLLGFSPLNPSLISNINALSFTSGNAGNVTVSTGQLTATDGGSIASSTLGIGNGGDVAINANSSIELIGVNPKRLAPSSISATTFNAGNAGSVTINTLKLVVKDGGRVDTSTAASGSAGSVTINAKDSVVISGKFPGSVIPSRASSSANILDLMVRQIFGLPPKPSGSSGNVTLNTGRLSVINGGQVNVRNDGSGDAGTLQISADSIKLDNQGEVTAATASGEGGNILLQAQNLQLRHNSSITATAGGSGNGGNITIDTGTLAALENSDITANAFEGRGGNIQISTQGLFRSPDSDITASSQLGIDGVVEIRTLGFDTTNALTPFADNFVSTEQVVANSCLARRNVSRGSFVVTGSGGLPLNPYSGMSEWELLTKPVANVPESPERSQRQPTSNQVATNRIPVAQVDAQRSQHNPTSNQVTAAVQPPEQPSDSNEIVIVRPEKKWKLGDPIVEAQGLVVTPDGRTLAVVAQRHATESPGALVCHPN